MGRSGVLGCCCFGDKIVDDGEGYSVLGSEGKLYMWTSWLASRRASSGIVPDVGRLRTLRNRTSSGWVRRWYAPRTCSVCGISS